MQKRLDKIIERAICDEFDITMGQLHDIVTSFSIFTDSMIRKKDSKGIRLKYSISILPNFAHDKKVTNLSKAKCEREGKEYIPKPYTYNTTIAEVDDILLSKKKEAQAIRKQQYRDLHREKNRLYMAAVRAKKKLEKLDKLKSS